MAKIESELFTRNVPGMLERLSQATIGIAGCGGLGSNAAVALVRAGVGKLILVDKDRVEASNLNRQYYFWSDIGKLKVEALAEYLTAIHKGVRLELHAEEITRQNVGKLFQEADLLIEAFDKAESKKWLMETWTRLFPEKYIVCGNGMAGLGRQNAITCLQAGKMVFCGDGVSEMSLGLCSARVAIVANMQAHAAIDLWIHGKIT